MFDASCKTSSGVSLNENQLSGQKLQNYLTDIILRFRKYKVGVIADIAKRYRQVLIDSRDLHYQEILWRDDAKIGELTEQWMLKTVTYGMAAVPFLAKRSLRQLAVDEGVNCPEASKTIL